MALTEIEYGSLASSQVLNDNFDFLNDEIAAVSAIVASNKSSFESQISTLNTNINAQFQTVNDKVSAAIPIATIIISQASTIPTGFLLCDGSELKISEYEELYEVIGTTYGQSDSTTFCIPDLTGRTVFGIAEDGTLGDYLEAGLPNITGSVQTMNSRMSSGGSGAFTGSDGSRTGSASAYGGTDYGGNATLRFNASNSNSIYGKSTTVQPPAIVTNFLIKY